MSTWDWDLHAVFLTVAIVSCVITIGVMVHGMICSRGDHLFWLRALTLVGVLDLGVVWALQLTGVMDLGATSQMIELPGAVLLISAKAAREIVGNRCA